VGSLANGKKDSPVSKDHAMTGGGSHAKLPSNSPAAKPSLPAKPAPVPSHTPSFKGKK
jgi:hypothetical protein